MVLGQGLVAELPDRFNIMSQLVRQLLGAQHRNFHEPGNGSQHDAAVHHLVAMANGRHQLFLDIDEQQRRLLGFHQHE